MLQGVWTLSVQSNLLILLSKKWCIFNKLGSSWQQDERNLPKIVIRGLSKPKIVKLNSFANFGIFLQFSISFNCNYLETLLLWSSDWSADTSTSIFCQKSLFKTMAKNWSKSTKTSVKNAPRSNSTFTKEQEAFIVKKFVELRSSSAVRRAFISNFTNP